MRRPSAFLAACGIVLALTSCAGGDDGAGQQAAAPTQSAESPTPAAKCDEPAKSEIQLVAKGTHFNAQCLVFPAGEAVTIELQNRAEGPLSGNHNVSIYTQEFEAEFTGETLYPGEKRTYEVPPLEAGTYLFQCDLHPADMSGPLIVR